MIMINFEKDLYKQNSKWVTQITRDHKPELPEEAYRIRIAGGRIA